MSGDTLPPLKGKVEVDTSELSRAVGRASKAGSAIGSALGTIGGNVATGLLDTAFSAVKNLTVGSITAASDLGETANKISTVFGPAAAAVNDFAATSATQFGLSKQAALDAQATFGVFGKSAGLSGKDLSGFAGQFTSLAADMASFSNTTPEQAIEALGSGLRGEAEPLRQYGILLDDATLRQEAVRLGLTKTTKEALTPQQKVLASQAAILKQTSDAQGDFGRTSDGLANRTRIAKAEFADMQTRLGQGLLPIVNTVLGALLNLTGPLGDVAQLIGDGIGGAFAKLQAGGGGGPAALFGQLGTSLAGVKDAVMGFVATILPSLQNLAGLFMTQIVPALMQVWTVIATNVVPAIGELVSALAPVAKFILDALGPVVVQIVRTLYGVIAGLVSVIGNLVRFVARVFKGDWAGAWEALKAIASTVISTLVNLVRGLWPIIKGLFSAGLNALKAVFSRVWDGFVTTAQAAAGRLRSFVSGLPGKIVGALGNLGGLLVDKGRQLVEGLISGIRNMGSRLAAFVRQWALDHIPGPIARALGIKSPSKVGIALGENFGVGPAIGIRRQTAGVRQAAVSLAAAAAGGFGAAAPYGALSPASRGATGGSGAFRLHPADLAALADAVSPNLYLDGDRVSRKVGKRLGAQTFDYARNG